MIKKNDGSVQLVSISTSPNDSYFMAYDLSSTRVSIYYQWDKSGSITYTSSILLKALTNLMVLKPFSWLSQYDLNTIQCSYKNLNQNQLEINYIYQPEDTSSASAVDIRQKLNRSHQRWQSGSWDQDSYNQTVRKNKFLSSSLVFTTTTSPQLHPTSTSRASFPENSSSRQMMVPWATDDEEEEEQELLHTTRRTNHHRDRLRLEVRDKFNLTVSLPRNESWSDRFVQLCVRCYRRPAMSDNDYVIQIVHPQRLIQYLSNEEEQDTLKQLDDELPRPVHVSLLLKRSDNGQCTVNNREWPVRAWTVSSDEDDEDDDGEEETALEDEQDIFVDGMEEIGHDTSPTIITETVKLRPPVMKPSSSAPVPSIMQLNQGRKSVDAYTQPHFISDHNIPAVALSPPVIMKTSQSQTTAADNKRKKQIAVQDIIITPRLVVIDIA